MSNPVKALLLKAIQQAPSADNSQPWHVNWQNENEFDLVYDAKRVAGRTFPADSPAILLSMGAVLENIRQITSKLNIEPEINYPKQIDLDLPVYFKVKFKKSDINKDLNGISTQSFSVFSRHTNRLPYSSEALSEEVISMFNDNSYGQAKAHIYTEKKTIQAIAVLVKNASKIRFKTQENLEWLAQSLRFGGADEKTGDGLSVATLDLPLGGGLFLKMLGNWKLIKTLNFFGMHLIMSFVDSIAVKKAPAIVAITAPSSIQGFMEAGQLMEKVWIELNEKGLAVHPYFVISDQIQRQYAGLIPSGMETQAMTLLEATQQVFHLGKERNLQILLRVGRPKKSVIRSRRLPIEEICSGL